MEVLSKSTEPTDRGEKWLNYQHIPSLETYILLSQRELKAEVYARQNSGAWLYTSLTEGALPLPCLNLNIDLSELYARLPEADLE